MLFIGRKADSLWHLSPGWRVANLQAWECVCFIGNEMKELSGPQKKGQILVQNLRSLENLISCDVMWCHVESLASYLGTLLRSAARMQALTEGASIPVMQRSPRCARDKTCSDMTNHKDSFAWDFGDYKIQMSKVLTNISFVSQKSVPVCLDMKIGTS